LGSQVAKGTLPFTGVALGAYIAVGGGLVLTGLALRLLSRAGDSNNNTDSN
jgi:hypothetical protein